MLPGRLDQVNEALLQQAVAEAWPEGSTLEFKAGVPPSADKHEFAKDVAALANAEGGDLVFGVASVSDCASAVLPIAGPSADAEMRRLGQTIDALIEPRISDLRWRLVPLQSGFALVLRVPPSFAGPHAVTDGVQRRFPMRSGTRVADMTYDQIRNAFDRTASLVQRASRFRTDRLEVILAGGGWRSMIDGPLCAVHFVPLSAMAARREIDVRKIHDSDQFTKFSFDDWGGASRNFNLDGIVVHAGRGVSDAPEGALTYVQIFRSGAIEFLRHAGPLSDPSLKVIPSTVVSAFIRGSLARAIAAAKVWGLAGPAIFGVSLLRVAGFGYATDRRFAIGNKVADRSDLIVNDAWIEEISTLDAVDDIARPVSDTIAQAFDISRCLDYDEQGVWLKR